ncbi:MAG: exodeoxyribonuclease VII small subunit [Anaerolineae bacterium]|nr:exodeoxyribonuclease VII small subunit [Anaerolineae bacterium]
MNSIEEMPFESALEELESVLEKLESGTLALDETVALYQRGRSLAEHCQHLLDTVELRVKQLSGDGAGSTNVVPFEDVASL